MITTKTLKMYGYNSINEYFSYIYDTLINRRHVQTIELIKDLSKLQKIEFYEYYLKDLSDKERRNKLIIYLLEECLK